MRAGGRFISVPGTFADSAAVSPTAALS